MDTLEKNIKENNVKSVKCKKGKFPKSMIMPKHA